MIQITSKTRLSFEEMGSLNFPDTRQNSGNRNLSQDLERLVACKGKKIASFSSRVFFSSSPTKRELGTNHGTGTLGRSPNKPNMFSQKLPERSSSADSARLAPIGKGAFARACVHLSRMNLSCQIIDASCNVPSELD